MVGPGWAAARRHGHRGGDPPIERGRTGPHALLGGLFRPLAAVGGYRWYMNHQRRLHTLVSHVRGREALSYAGRLAISTIVDPDHFPDLDTLIAGLRRELDLITRAGSGPAS